MRSNQIAVVDASRDEEAVIGQSERHRFPRSFTHISADGQKSSYYSYRRAEALAADGFSALAETGMIECDTGGPLRRRALALSATRSTTDSFRTFRDRDVDPAAMLVCGSLVKMA